MQRRDANVVVLENSILVRTSSHLLHNAIIELVFILDAFKMFLKIRAQPRTLLRYVHDKISLRPNRIESLKFEARFIAVIAVSFLSINYILV